MHRVLDPNIVLGVRALAGSRKRNKVTPSLRARRPSLAAMLARPLKPLCWCGEPVKGLAKSCCSEHSFRRRYSAISYCWCGRVARVKRVSCCNEHALKKHPGYRTPKQAEYRARINRVALPKAVRAEARDRLTAQQNGACAICGRADQKLVLDHCHETRTPRAMLCSGCNTAVGLVREDPRIARALVDYCEVCQEHRKDQDGKA